MPVANNCHVHPQVVVHAPASCGRGLECDGRSILEVMRRRRRRHAKSSENVLCDFPWHTHYGKMSLNYASLLHTCFRHRLHSPTVARLDRRLDDDPITSARWRGPRTHARATTNFLEIKAVDSLSGAGPPRHPSPLNKKRLRTGENSYTISQS